MGERRRISIVGPTASGKTTLSIALAKTLAIPSIISCDSMAIYRYMDIGTAKPSKDELAGIDCYMIDIVDPDQEYSVAQFSKMTATIEARSGEVSVIFVGGSGLYHTAVFDHLEPPPTDPALREAITLQVAQRGIEWGYSRLVVLDPTAAQKIEPANLRRIVRALEVIEITKRPFSSFGPGVDAYPESSGEIIGLFPGRDRLEERIRDRNELLFQRGWVDECAFLIKNFELYLTAARAIGYSEIFSHIKGELSLDEAKERIVLRSRNFAKRQMAWFRRDPRVKWFEGPDDAFAYLSSL